MFNKFTVDKVKRRANLKTSLVVKLCTSATKSMPRFNEIKNEVFPKKQPVIIHHLENRVMLYSAKGTPLLIELDDGTIFPFLKIAIEYPGLLKPVFCYDEAMKALLRGANLMARGTWLVNEKYEKGEIVEICLVGLRIPFAIGIMLMSSEEIAGRPDGAAVKVLHVLKDGLWEAKNL
ncbi:Translation machinery-associated protein 20 [Histomonas meleagridis]|uniref:Translation machinery-associated protein 20 n=1 Tax=Histomonas meleagridis TaxID=135588 RepID=UPI00355998F6|nr:Translation machinery-associated protein 20 [Histomonas meleagridis]KAH0802565.1 Translation machinery-associated protein 20 [Histomonas meleagridis]